MSIAEGTSRITIDLPEDLPAVIAQTREAFAEALRLAAAIEWYRQGRISQGQGARLAGLSRADFLDELARAEVPACQVTVDELMEEVDRAAEAYRRRIAPDPAVEGGSA